MPERILFLTGKLAEKRLHRVLEAMQPADFSYEVRNLGVSVAALMTAEMIKRRVTQCNGIDRMIVPGLCRVTWNPSARYWVSRSSAAAWM
ncbi:MAG: DUF6513 domain-containing protein [Thiotrichales bacterium]|nr:DUF6513 domain-containing protein [Thiotrichales bacterium]